MKSIAERALDQVDHLTEQAGSQLIGSPAGRKAELRPARYHLIFHFRGTPGIALTGKGNRDIYHTLSDTIDRSSGEKLSEAIRPALDRRGLSWSRAQM